MAKFGITQETLIKVQPISEKLIEVAADEALEAGLTIGEAMLALALAYGCTAEGMEVSPTDSLAFAQLGIKMANKAADLRPTLN